MSVFVAISQALATESVTLGWDPSPDPTVIGYNVYYGSTSGNYGSKINAGNSTTATIPGLSEGTTYYFAVTAYDVTGLESPPSNEIAYTVPGVLLQIKKIRLSGFPNAYYISSTGTAPPSWQLQASEDLKRWRVLTTGTNSTVGVTVVTYNAPSLFFRLAKP